MTKSLRVLNIEDSEDDAALVVRQLRQSGYDPKVKRVCTPGAMNAALREQTWDLVITDWSMPQFSAPAALELLKSMELDLPFIIVSGTIGEDIAVAAMKAGAHDYLMKDNLARLVPAIERELQEAEGRRERKRAEESLRQSEARLRAVLDSALDAFVGMDAHGIITDWNPRSEAIFGWSRMEAVGRNLAETIIPPQYREAYRRGLQQFLATGEGPVPDRRIEIAAMRRDGSEFPVELSVCPLKVGASYRFTAFIAEITERKQLEAQLRQAQKMEAVGQLAGGIAHDFNNLFTIVRGHSDLLLTDDPTLSQDQRDSLEQIAQAGKRAAALTAQLLAFSRRQILQPKVVDLNAVVTNMKQMLCRQIGETIKLITVLPPSLGRVTADPSQLEQVILNLVVNARDAMPRGGRLTIATGNIDLDESYVRQHAGARPGPHVRLAVSDNGTGMDKETLSHLFEPFFTTKELGKGTGLGLSTVYGIVKQSAGYISVDSEPGRGTTFTVYLPRVTDEVEAAEFVHTTAEVPLGSETVLLVEDEEMVRALARRILQTHGYNLLEAQDGFQALRLCQEYTGMIHLLVTDVVMPGMSGRAVADHLLSVRPSMKVLYLSGYTDNSIVHHGVMDTGTAFLPKPFTPADLARKVREVLDRTSTK